MRLLRLASRRVQADNSRLARPRFDSGGPVMAGRSEGRQSDVSAMQKVSDQQYREYVRNQEILFLDPNRVLRLTESGAPLAATREQVEHPDRGAAPIPVGTPKQAAVGPPSAAVPRFGLPFPENLRNFFRRFLPLDGKKPLPLVGLLPWRKNGVPLRPAFDAGMSGVSYRETPPAEAISTRKHDRNVSLAVLGRVRRR